LLTTFADQAVIAIENVRLFNETKEALEQQTATSEVLRAISRAHTDAQPVFDIIAASALQLCGAVFSAMVLYDGKILRLVAIQNAQPEGVEALRKVFPRPLDEESAASRAIRSRAVVNIPDVFHDPHFAYGNVARAANYRSVLAVPMMRDGEPVGVILATRPEAGPFSGKETELLKTFADQAVIAIENVRLFTELQEKNRALTDAHAQVSEALEQQTATGDILGAISGSPTDVQPVFETIVRNAARLCDATDTSLYQLQGDVLRCVANYGTVASALVGETRPITRGTASGRAVLDRCTIHLADVFTDVDQFPEVAAAIRREGIRAVLSVPLLRRGLPIGAMRVRRTEAKPYTDKQVKLIETFADQAVIAIENVRLFTELEARNRELTEALDQQTATSEILEVISRSQTDVQPAF